MKKLKERIWSILDLECDAAAASSKRAPAVPGVERSFSDVCASVPISEFPHASVSPFLYIYVYVYVHVYI